MEQMMYSKENNYRIMRNGCSTILLYTSNTPFSMDDWCGKQIKNVFAGTNCIMAVTERGETLQKNSVPDCMSRTRYWTRIKQIGISNWATGAAIGLVEDGTCIIAKRPIRRICEDRCLNFEHINNTIKSWTGIVQVAASDAFFALRNDGTVQYVSFCERNQEEYEEVNNWRSVVKIVTGTQNSVFGITKYGTILVAGYNGMHLQSHLQKLKNVLDVFPTGSECEVMYVLMMDGSVISVPYGLENYVNYKLQKLDGHIRYKAIALTESQSLVDISDKDIKLIFPEQYKITSFAVGDNNYAHPFVVAIAELE